MKSNTASSVLPKAVAAALAVALVVGLVWYVARQAPADPVADPAADAPKKLEVGKRYWAFVSTLEAYPTAPGDENWDVGDSAPDLEYEIWWRGNEIYESSRTNDALIGVWTGLHFPPEFVKNMLLQEGVPLEKVVSAARFSVDDGEGEAGCVLELRVYDHDTGSANDMAGVHTYACTDLVVGRNRFEYPPSAVNALRFVELRVFPLDLTPAELMNLLAIK